MVFVEIPTEQTTAVTDAVLALLAAGAYLYVRHLAPVSAWKARLWRGLFVLLAVAAILGAVVHGIRLPYPVQASLWAALNLYLGLIIAIFVVAVVYDLWGEAVSRKALPIMLTAGLGFWGLTLLFPGSFRLFIVYEAVAMLFALGGYIRLVFTKHLPGGGWMAAGIFVTIVAALIQASAVVSFTLIWSFDYNGVYHLVQMPGILLLLVGLRKGLSPRA